MKKIIIALTLAAFVTVPALQAGEGKECNKGKTACTEAAKASACASACSGKKGAVTKKLDPAGKGATLLVRR